VLRTERLILRNPRAADAADLFAVFGDPATMRYWSTVPDPNPAATVARVDRLIAGIRNPPIDFVMEKDGQAIGIIGAHNVNEVGFILNRAFWRQGLVREAMQALIPYLFGVIDCTELTADADPRNVASISLLKSFGFVVTGTAPNTFCIDGEWVDSTYLALCRAQNATG
jgi:ribosomal-protein-alanine N-acetyltransferase